MPATLTKITAEIEQLSLADQIELMERLIQLVRQRTALPSVSDDDLALMAQDPHIQQEIAALHAGE